MPQMQTSIRTLESNISSIYNLFAPHLMCPGSSLPFANETHLRAEPSSRSISSRSCRRFAVEMTKDRSLFPLNLEDAGIVLRQNVVLMNQSHNLLGLFSAAGKPPKAGGLAVRIYNSSSCADWHASYWRVEWEVAVDLREQVWILWLMADLILCPLPDDSISVVWREIYGGVVCLEILWWHCSWELILLI